MRFRRQRGLSGRDLGLLVLLGLFGLALFAALLGLNLRAGRLVPGGGGFLSPWAASRGFLFNRTEPYSGEIAGSVQRLVYGGGAQNGENPYLLTVPFFLMPVFYPVGLVPDPGMARALWMVVSEVALVAGVLLSLRLIDLKPGPFTVGALILYSFSGYFALAALMDGSTALVLGLIYLVILSWLLAGRDLWAGVLLVLALFHFETGLLFLVFVVWRVFAEARREVFAGLGMTLIILLAISYLTYPGWMIPFLRACLVNLRADYGFVLGQALTQLWPAFGAQLARTVSIASLLLLGFEWAAFHPEPRRYLWVACLTLTVTVLLGIRLEMSDLVILLPAWILIFSSVLHRWQAGAWMALGLGLVTLGLPWYLFARNKLFGDPLSLEILFAFYPVVTLVGLYWSRWWFIHSPRTWLDTVRMNREG